MPKKWPPIPKSVMGAGGPITVKLVDSCKGEKGDDAWGTWVPETRTIEIDRKASPEHQWRVLGHEIAHAVLADTGLVNLLTDESQEALCDAFGTARVMEMRGGLNPP